MVKNGSFTRPLIAGIAAGIADPFLQDLARRFNLGVSDDIIRILLGVALPAVGIGKKGVLRDILQAEMILGAAGLARGIGIGLSPTMTTTMATSTGTTF